MANHATRRAPHCFNLLRQVRVLKNAGMGSADSQLKDRCFVERSTCACSIRCSDIPPLMVDLLCLLFVFVGLEEFSRDGKSFPDWQAGK